MDLSAGCLADDKQPRGCTETDDGAGFKPALAGLAGRYVFSEPGKATLANQVRIFNSCILASFCSLV